MRKISGAHDTSSGYAVLVRMGVFPLQYELVFRAIFWYLKICHGKSDPALTDQLEELRSEGGEFDLTCFYRHCHNYINQISSLVGVNIFELRECERKDVIRSAMYIELNNYWQTLSEASITREIHPTWEYRRLPSFMHTRYSYTLMNNLALGRGPLRGTIHRKRDISLQICRHCCNQVENLNHLVNECTKMKEQREYLKKRCEKETKAYSLRTLFSDPELQIDTERMLLRFFNRK